jgi:hypothetical protein
VDALGTDGERPARAVDDDEGDARLSEQARQQGGEHRGQGLDLNPPEQAWKPHQSEVPRTRDDDLGRIGASWGTLFGLSPLRTHQGS